MTETPEEIPHGTYAGYQRHKKRGVRPCEACLAANRDYTANLRANSPELRENDALMNKIRSRALWRLKDRHQREFRVLVAEELRAEDKRRTAS